MNAEVHFAGTPSGWAWESLTGGAGARISLALVVEIVEDLKATAYGGGEPSITLQVPPDPSYLQQVAARLGLAPRTDPGELIASGFIEADEASVTTELGGRIVAIHAGEGDQVTAGQVVVEWDSSMLQAQIEQAQADVAVAEAVLAQVKAGVRPETLDYAQALVDYAREVGVVRRPPPERRSTQRFRDLDGREYGPG